MAIAVAVWAVVGAPIDSAAAAPAAAPPASAAASAPSTASAPSDGNSKSKLPLRTDRSTRPLRLSGDDDGIGYGRLLAYLLIVAALALGGIYVAKRFLPRLGPAASGQRIRVVDSAYVGPRKQVLILQVGQRKFLVGSCRDSLTLLSEITESFSDIYESKKASASGDAAGADVPDEAGG
jgi:flagellar biosynthetic protein FliO